MLKIVAWSLLGLATVWLGARSCGLTPTQVDDRILLAELNADAGEVYRRTEAQRAGMVALAGGLLVEVLAEGHGEVPAADDWVQLHYRGWYIDGREFDNSWRRGEPATLPVEEAIPGWRQALRSTPVGTRLRLIVPPELAYGRSGAGIIGPEETLVFELELQAIVQPDSPPELDETQQPVPNLGRAR